MQPNLLTLSPTGAVGTEINLDNVEDQEQKDNSENERKQQLHTVGKSDI